MDVSKVNEFFKEDECGPLSICAVEEESETKPRRWSDLPTGSPKLQCQFLSFSHFLSSLQKIPSVQQTRMWVLKCDFSLGFGDFGVISITPPSPLEKDGSPDQEDDSDEDKGQKFDDQTQNDKWPLLSCVERSHSVFLRGKNTFNPSPFESESFGGNNDAISQCQIFESKDPALESTLTYDCLQVAKDASFLFSDEHEENSETTSHSKSPEMNSSSSCSASSSNCFLTELHVASAEFVCFWNTCNHKEKNTDRLFHHILHCHLHRSTDFRSTRCLWRGCSRDGILKVFNSRHKLLVHVGIHCQKLREPQIVSIFIIFFLGTE